MPSLTWARSFSSLSSAESSTEVGTGARGSIVPSSVETIPRFASARCAGSPATGAPAATWASIDGSAGIADESADGSHQELPCSPGHIPRADCTRLLLYRKPSSACILRQTPHRTTTHWQEETINVLFE